MSKLPAPSTDVDSYFAELEVLDRLHRLPDTVMLTTMEAAIFLRSSVSKLESMRSNGSGPRYIQGGAKGSRGANQPCLYEKGDLLTWLRAQKVTSVAEATTRQGQI